MSHAIPQTQLNSSTLEAEIQCGSHAGVGYDQGHTVFLYSRNGCAKRRGQANRLSFSIRQVSY